MYVCMYACMHVCVSGHWSRLALQTLCGERYDCCVPMACPKDPLKLYFGNTNPQSQHKNLVPRPIWQICLENVFCVPCAPLGWLSLDTLCLKRVIACEAKGPKVRAGGVVLVKHDAVENLPLMMILMHKSPRANFGALFICGKFPRSSSFNFQRKTKGQQLKGKIVSECFTLFHQISHLFIIFPPWLSPSKQRVLAQGEQKRRKDNKKNRTNRCCTLVVARLSSS